MISGTKNSNGETALHLAVINNRLEIVLLLLKNGANIEAKNSNDETALHLATRRGNYKIIQQLLKHGANVEARNANGETPFHHAKNKPPIIQLLLANKAKINAKDNDGNTVLHKTRGYHTEFLLDNGADITVQNNDGKTPLQLAAGSDFTSISEQFLSIIIKKISAFGRFDCLQEDFYLSFLKKTLSADSKNWQEELAIAAKEESIDTPASMISKISTYTKNEDKLPIIKIIERQYANAMALAKTSSLTSGILLPNIDYKIPLSSIEEGLKALSLSTTSSSSLAEDAVTPSPTLLLWGNHQANEAAAALDANEYCSDDELTSGISKSVRR
ncbi:ankyrin repeat domain-containing protein [Candidatus Berkiella aquae]|uniref:Ankyrin repeat domain-containing protein n=1 Tax=Candidatus Berkiella aquae TaxID=295108 RepID=A0A0Q9YKB4_9GAMM|nr:ankyrin repeat domain-containing protein [Candidatus Berkiella aquae]MCS5711213.1 ankyrin repeat domain-containing protein [Candidatus Berkiella aquae]